MTDVCKCPNCNQPVAADNQFCIFCGTKLPAFEKTPETDEGGVPGTAAVRKCRNGHEFTDDLLTYCPICGLPLEKAAAEEANWTCICGHVNVSETHFCVKCGRPEGAKPPERKPKEKTGPGGAVPEGMYIPTADDLRKKR